MHIFLNFILINLIGEDSTNLEDEEYFGSEIIHVGYAKVGPPLARSRF